eukprot:115187-Hanusia_phi.AAC.1
MAPPCFVTAPHAGAASSWVARPFCLSLSRSTHRHALSQAPAASLRMKLTPKHVGIAALSTMALLSLAAPHAHALSEHASALVASDVSSGGVKATVARILMTTLALGSLFVYFRPPQEMVVEEKEAFDEEDLRKYIGADAEIPEYFKRRKEEGEDEQSE